MKAEFQVRYVLDEPEVRTKGEMMEIIQITVKDFADKLGGAITDVELLNHTVKFSE